MDLPVHTLIGDENKEGGLLLCGLNHGYSKEDERQDAAGIDRSDPYKSFFSDKEVNDYKFRNKLVKWFSLWGHPLEGDKCLAGPFERSLVQTNWLQSCSRDMGGVNVYQACIGESESFLRTCEILKPGAIFFFGKEMLPAFTSPELAERVESIFGTKLGATDWRQENVYQEGRLLRRFKVGFQRYANLNVVSLPHATGAQGIADDYISAFRPKMSEVLDSWWNMHKKRLGHA